MSSSSSEDEEFCSPSNRVQKAAKALMDKKAESRKFPSLNDVKSNLEAFVSTKPRRFGSRLSDKKELKDSLQDLNNDLQTLQNKFDCFFNSMMSIVEEIETIEDKMGDLENRVISLERKDISYSRAVRSTVPSEDAETQGKRIERLEFVTSEETRKSRTLQVTLTHPQIDKSHENFPVHIKNFLETKLNLERRKIDTNMIIGKGQRENTAQITFSHRRFKLFLFTARKQLVENDEEERKKLFINDNLTNLNFSIIMKLKELRKNRQASKLPCFESVYTFEGKPYIKIKRTDSNNDAIHVKSLHDIPKLIEKLSSGNDTSPSPRTP